MYAGRRTRAAHSTMPGASTDRTSQPSPRARLTECHSSCHPHRPRRQAGRRAEDLTVVVRSGATALPITIDDCPFVRGRWLTLDRLKLRDSPATATTDPRGA